MHPVGPVCSANEQRTLNSTRQTTTTAINVTTDREKGEREEEGEGERGKTERATVRCLFYCVLIFAIYAKARHCTRSLSVSLSLCPCFAVWSVF